MTIGLLARERKVTLLVGQSSETDHSVPGGGAVSFSAEQNKVSSIIVDNNIISYSNINITILYTILLECFHLVLNLLLTRSFSFSAFSQLCHFSIE